MELCGVPTRCKNNNLLIFQSAQNVSCRRAPDHRPPTIWVHYTTCCKSQSCAPDDGQKLPEIC